MPPPAMNSPASDPTTAASPQPSVSIRPTRTLALDRVGEH